MEIKNRLFPYPVLCGDTDDYLETTEFALEPTITETTHELIFSYDYILNCNSIENLLRKGSAEYVLHLECSATAFRVALKSKVPHIEYRLPKARVNGEINLVAMIVARVSIKDFPVKDLNGDYIGESINFPKGAILAYQNLPSIYIAKETEELANNESFFTIIKQASLDPNEIKPLTFNLNSPKIQILVDEKTYEAFVRYQHTHAIAMAMLVLPALSFMVSEVRENPDIYSQYLWFRRMEKFYMAQNKNFVTDILQKEENPVTIAQEMLQNPVSNAYRELYALEG